MVTEEHIEWIVAPEDMQVAYTLITAITTASAQESFPLPDLSVTVAGSPGRPPIRIDLGNISGVSSTLDILDVSGRVVWQQHFPAEDRQTVRRISWDGLAASGRRLPNGIYFARLTQGSEAVTSRMVVLR